VAASTPSHSSNDQDPLSRHAAYVRNRKYLDARWQALVEEFRGEWIAILDEHVACHAADVDEVMQWLIEGDAIPMAAIELMTEERPLSFRPS